MAGDGTMQVCPHVFDLTHPFTPQGFDLNARFGPYLLDVSDQFRAHLFDCQASSLISRSTFRWSFSISRWRATLSGIRT